MVNRIHLGMLKVMAWLTEKEAGAFLEWQD
jgi:hypothetical protein